MKEYNICGYIDDCPVYCFVFKPICSNMYIMICDNHALVIDPYMDEYVKQFLYEKGVMDVTILLTHEHYDHISGVNEFRMLYECTVISNKYTQEKVMSADNNLARYFMAIFINKPEEEELAKKVCIEDYTCSVDKSFETECEMDWCTKHLILRETPGHSEGSICIVVNDSFIFTGDTIVGGAKIITRFPGGSKKRYVELTKEYLDSLKKDMYVFPGHGDSGLLSNFDIL